MGTNDGGQTWGDERRETETCSCLSPLLGWLQEVKGDGFSQEDKMGVESRKKSAHLRCVTIRAQRCSDKIWKPTRQEQMDPADVFRGPFKNN